MIDRKRFFDPAVVVKVDTFSDRQERAKAALGKCSSQIRIVQKVRSLKEAEEEQGPSSFPETDPSNRSPDFVQLERFVDDIDGGIEMSARRRQEVDADDSLST